MSDSSTTPKPPSEAASSTAFSGLEPIPGFGRQSRFSTFLSLGMFPPNFVIGE